MYLRKLLAVALTLVSIFVSAQPASADAIRDREYWISDYGFQKAWKITKGAGVPVVYDSVGKNSFDQSLNSLAQRGYFVSFGTTTGAPPPIPASTLQKMGSLYFTRPTLVTYTASTEELRHSAQAVFDLFAKGALKITINQRYALQDIAKAHAELESGKTSGSSVIIP